MIKLIGFKRALMLGIIFAINVILLAIYLVGVEPMRSDAENQRNSILTDISGFQSKIQNIKQEMAAFNENLPKYRLLEQNGFFSDQDRFKMGRDLESIRQGTQVRGFGYNIGNMVRLQSPDLDAVGQSLYLSPIIVSTLDVLTDVDVFQYIDEMMAKFPAHLRLDGFSLKRKDLNAQVLKDLAAGVKNTRTVDADLTFNWVTVTSKAPAATMPSTGGLK